MFRNFVISAIRSIQRQKLFSTINILGLSVGISVSLMLFLFTQHEMSYDKFHENGDRIFKVISRYTTNQGTTGISGISFGSVVPEMKKEIPEVEDATRVFNAGLTDVVNVNTTFQEQRLYYVDRAFFDIFSFKSVYGSAFEKPAFDNKGIVISSEFAKTVYGNSSPLGERLKIDGEEFTVLDIVEVPKKSHLLFDVAISLENIPNLHSWAYQSGLDFHSYGLYAPNTNHNQVDAKIAALYNKQMDERFQNFISGSDNYVQPFSDIYLKSEHISNNLTTGSINTIYILSAINLLILFIAVVNYINLTTAQYEKRIKEIGVRKVIGANRKTLIFQFLGESIIFTMIAFVIAIWITQLLIQPFGELMGIAAEVTFWENPIQLIGMITAVIVLGIISGLYPALFISSFRPVKILKRDFLRFGKGTKGSKVLVTLQFIIAIVLVTNLAFLNKQIDFVKNKELGFSKEQILVVNNLSDKQKGSYQSIFADITANSNILSITGSQSALGTGTSGQTVYLEGESAKTAQPIGELRTVHNFINTYDIKLIKGRDFSEELVTDGQGFLINKSGEQILFPDGTNPIGKRIVIAGRVGPILGVVEDFHYTNLKRKINPLVISLDEPYRLTLSIKLNPQNIEASLEHIEQSLQKVDPEHQLGYYFLDDYFNTMFEAEERNASLISYSSLVTALISLVGLIALISHGLAKRMKEVAIRKILGAPFAQLLWLLTKEYYFILLFANIIAIPTGILVMEQWLPTFAYRINPGNSWVTFALIGIISLVITFGLIMGQVVKRTRANPAEVLGNE